jgi:hypothetical protein
MIVKAMMLVVRNLPAIEGDEQRSVHYMTAYLIQPPGVRETPMTAIVTDDEPRPPEEAREVRPKDVVDPIRRHVIAKIIKNTDYGNISEHVVEGRCDALVKTMSRDGSLEL